MLILYGLVDYILIIHYNPSFCQNQESPLARPENNYIIKIDYFLHNHLYFINSAIYFSVNFTILESYECGQASQANVDFNVCLLLKSGYYMNIMMCA